MNFRKLITHSLIALIVGAMLAAFQAAPAFAGSSDEAPETITLRVNNNTAQRVVLYLYSNGNTPVELEIEEWYGVVDLPAGRYRYTYNACGGNQQGSFNVAEGNTLLSLPICDGISVNYSVKAEEMRNLDINNRSGETIQVSLVGLAEYQFTVSGNKVSVDVVPGRYQAYFTACGIDYVMAVNLLHKDGQLSVPRCETPASSRVKVQNHTGEDMVVTLSGPEYLTVTIDPGTTRLDLAQGTYNFTVWSQGKCITGTLEVVGKVVNWSWWNN
ncbi:MAG: hypothetical protein DWQ07_00330 [Chloroflexi bacterium]|nr:MAG: hypothetical protein DWQ07_00330 [Chloroflexota bacterium]MBL1195780.1 hypothetical protein [Chloroflexota bacterium]NOH13071.1 hypothetical protein [Chloroflexota bacterium]